MLNLNYSEETLYGADDIDVPLTDAQHGPSSILAWPTLHVNNAYDPFHDAVSIGHSTTDDADPASRPTGAAPSRDNFGHLLCQSYLTFRNGIFKAVDEIESGKMDAFLCPPPPAHACPEEPLEESEFEDEYVACLEPMSKLAIAAQQPAYATVPLPSLAQPCSPTPLHPSAMLAHAMAQVNFTSSYSSYSNSYTASPEQTPALAYTPQICSHAYGSALGIRHATSVLDLSSGKSHNLAGHYAVAPLPAYAASDADYDAHLDPNEPNYFRGLLTNSLSQVPVYHLSEPHAAAAPAARPCIDARCDSLSSDGDEECDGDMSRAPSNNQHQAEEHGQYSSFDCDQLDLVLDLMQQDTRTAARDSQQKHIRTPYQAPTDSTSADNGSSGLHLCRSHAVSTPGSPVHHAQSRLAAEHSPFQQALRNSMLACEASRGDEGRWTRCLSAPLAGPHPSELLAHSLRDHVSTPPLAAPQSLQLPNSSRDEAATPTAADCHKPATSARPRVSKHELRQLFQLPIEKARARVGLSKNAFKKLLVDFGFKRWPQRQLMGLHNLLEKTAEDRLLSNAQRQTRILRIKLNLTSIMDGSEFSMYKDLQKASHVYHNRLHTEKSSRRDLDFIAAPAVSRIVVHERP